MGKIKLSIPGDIPKHISRGESPGPYDVWVESDEYYTLQLLAEIRKISEQIANIGLLLDVSMSEKHMGPKKRVVAENATTDEVVIDEA